MVKILKTIVLFTILIFSLSACERIDAGCEGIKVNLYGDDKGVGNVSLCTGMVQPFYNSDI